MPVAREGEEDLRPSKELGAAGSGGNELSESREVGSRRGGEFYAQKHLLTEVPR